METVVFLIPLCISRSFISTEKEVIKLISWSIWAHGVSHLKYC